MKRSDASTPTDVHRLYLITDGRGRDPEQLGNIVSLAIAGGVTLVQLREQSDDQGRLLAAASAVTEACNKAGVPLLLNASLQAIYDSDRHAGIHVGRNTAHLLKVRPFRIGGYSAHSIPEVRRAIAAGATFLTYSPVFPTASKPGAAGVSPGALESARCALRTHSPPSGAKLIALGGITEANAEACIRAGADGVAVISAVMEAANPGEAASRLRVVLDRALA